MARSCDLPIYKAAYQLFKLVIVASSRFSRDFRPVLGQPLQEEVAKIIVTIYRANTALDKLPYLANLHESLVKVEPMVQLAFELKLINPDVFAEACEILCDIGKQVGGWQKYAASRTTSVQVHAAASDSSPATELLR